MAVCEDSTVGERAGVRGTTIGRMRFHHRLTKHDRLGVCEMLCPFCQKGETKVVDSRGSQEYVIRRRRECLDCGRRFTTYEKIEESPLKVIKKDGARIPFDREKIRAGIEKACYKRPISPDQIERIVGDIERDVYAQFDREVPSRYVGEKVMDALKLVDQVAFVRFASVYRSFQDVNDFVQELQPILKERTRR